MIMITVAALDHPPAAVAVAAAVHIPKPVPNVVETVSAGAVAEPEYILLTDTNSTLVMYAAVAENVLHVAEAV